MPQYQLDSGPKGRITLPSGEWEYFITRLVSMPERRVQSQTLVFGHANHAGDTMRCTLDPDLASIDDETIRGLGLDPDERYVNSDDGRYWVTRADADPGANELLIRVRSPRKQYMKIEEPSAHHLGELTHDELLGIFKSFGL